MKKNLILIISFIAIIFLGRVFPHPYNFTPLIAVTLLSSYTLSNKLLAITIPLFGFWLSDLFINNIIENKGSIQHIKNIPEDLKNRYKTVWEVPMKDIIDMARHRGYFIDQSQSLNLFMEGATAAKLTSMHFYGWKSGLKTGMYYLRTKSAVDAIKFTLDNSKKAKVEKPVAEKVTSAPAAASKKNTDAKGKQIVAKPLSPEELKEMLDKSKGNEDDDCLMCGS